MLLLPEQQQLVRLNCFLLLISMSALSSCGASNKVNTVSFSQNVEVHAHRGGAALHPENSIVAFRAAVSQVGSNSVELDIHQTTDRALIVNHDFEINPLICLDPHRKHIENPPQISHMSLAEVRKYDCGPLMGLPPGTPLPTLDEVFATTSKLKTPSGTGTQYDVHVKWDPETIGADDYVSLILSTIKKYGVLNRVHFMNDSKDLLTAARRQEPSLGLYYLLGKVQASDFAFAAQLQVTAAAPIGDSLDAATVQGFHQLGVKVIPWTVDAPYEWDSLLNMGVDGIITDNPVGLKQLLQGNLDFQILSGSGGD